MHITRAFLDGMNDINNNEVHIDDTLMAEICSPMIPENDYAEIVNSSV